MGDKEPRCHFWSTIYHGYKGDINGDDSVSAVESADGAPTTETVVPIVAVPLRIESYQKDTPSNDTVKTNHAIESEKTKQEEFKMKQAVFQNLHSVQADLQRDVLSVVGLIPQKRARSASVDGGGTTRHVRRPRAAAPNEPVTVAMSLKEELHRHHAVA